MTVRQNERRYRFRSKKSTLRLMFDLHFYAKCQRNNAMHEASMTKMMNSGRNMALICRISSKRNRFVGLYIYYITLANEYR